MAGRNSVCYAELRDVKGRLGGFCVYRDSLERETLKARNADQQLVKQMNTALVVDVLRQFGPLSRAEVSRMTNLTKVTVSTIVRDILQRKIVREIGLGTTTSHGGRRPTLLELIPESFFAVGIDIGTTSVKVVLTNLTGAVISEASAPTVSHDSLDKLLEEIVRIVRQVLREAGVSVEELKGVGVAAAGIVKSETGFVVFSPNFGWRSIQLKRILEDELRVPVFVDNCTRVMAKGEIWFGCGKDVMNMLYLNIGYGIGSAMVVRGSVAGNDSELGHIRLSPTGPPCRCGGTGCLETLASGSAIEARAKESLDGRSDSGLIEALGDSTRSVTVKELAEAAANGNALAQEIFREAGLYLGEAIAVAVSVLRPELVVIGGGVSQTGEPLLQPVLDGFRTNVMPDLHVDIVLSPLGQRAGVLGGASLVLDAEFGVSR